MGFSIETSVSAVTVFLQGALSFFSPCVLPLVPLYVSYLAGGAAVVGEDGVRRYPRGKIFLNTLFFVVGISFAFFLLGLGLTALGEFFHNYQVWFARASGVIILLFGLYQLGLGKRTMLLEQEHRLPFHLNKLAMNPAVALVMGFTFSFAWTPCVGPTLSSVLLMASSAESSAAGFLLIGVYTLGFVLPFLAVGLFTGTVLDFFKSHQNVVRYTVKIGAVLLIVMGILTLTGATGGISADLAAGSGTVQEEPAGNSGEEAAPSGDSQEEHSGADSQEIPMVPAPDFTLTDQYGQTHTLSDYQGKTVFLNFWATWCGPCKMEMPDIQALYEDWDENAGELVVLGVAGPNIGQEGSAEDITAFLEENGYTYPVVMDGHALLPVRHQRLSHHIHDRHGGQRLRLRPGRRQPGGHGRHRGADQDRAAQMIHPGRRGRTFAVPAAFSRAAESACKKVVNLRQFVLESNSYRGPLRRRGTPIDRKRRGTPMAHNDSFDEPRFEALYRKLYPDLLRCAEIALRTGGSWYVSVAGRAEEVVQELFAFAWEHQADLWSSASPTGWLYRVLRYKVLELLKEDRFWRKHLIRAAGEMPASPEDDFQQRAEITSILTPEEYEILRKLYLEKYTYEELAREMGLKKSALAMRVKRSKERFVKQWNRH